MMETLAIPVWMIAAGVAAIAAFAMIMTWRKRGWRVSAVQAMIPLLLLGAGWVYLDHVDRQAQAERRRGIETRLTALNAQALASNSPLACLEGGGDNLLQESCEKTLYATPDRTAAALAFVGARIDLLREIAALPAGERAQYETLRAPYLKALEADRFGLVAQVLQQRDGCTPEHCDVFAWMTARDRVIANMKEGAYQSRVARYSVAWGDKGAAPAAQSAGPQAPAAASAPVNMDFPSAASIPPVSIMSNEPGMPGQNGVDSTAKPAPAAPAPKRAVKAPPPPRAPAPATQSSPFPRPVGSPPAQTTGSPPRTPAE